MVRALKLDSHIFLRAVVFGAFQLFIFYILFDVQALYGLYTFVVVS